MSQCNVTLSPKTARKLIFDALTGAGTRPANAGYFADAILDTELSGMAGHGFYWLQYYCEHVRSGKVDGKAVPKLTRQSPVAFRVDARRGFAHPAIERGFGKLVPAARRYGIAGLAVYNSYNAATLGYHTGYLAKQGLVAFGFTNTTPAIAPVGGRNAVIGTNPISFAVPGRRKSIAFLIDQSASAVSWTAVKLAADERRPIPLGWAIDAEGRPTTDAARGLAGSMANDGRSIGCGQFFMALDPNAFSGGHFSRQIGALARSITVQPGARLPNAKRAANQKRLAKQGLSLDRALYDRLKSFAAGHRG
jgi:(2R)-3-sulfolactate dehydrogenase (NADP+)